MATINQKYLKDENGEIFSPVVSSDSIYMKNNISLNTIINEDLIETLIYFGTIDMNGDNVVSFASNEIKYIAGGYIRNSYFEVKTNGFYKVTTAFRFLDTSNEADKCVGIVFMDANGTEKVECNNWNYNGQRLTVYCEGLCYLSKGERIGIRTYNLADNNNIGNAMPTAIFLYKPYSQINI